MSNKTILDIDEYCFADILAYLDIKDHANISQVCQRFRQGFVTSSAKQYKIFTTKKCKMQMFFITSGKIEKLRVEFDEIMNILREHSCDHQQNMLRNFCMQFQNMKALKRLELNFEGCDYEILSHFNICDEMVKFLKDLPHLNELQIESYLVDYNFDAFCELKQLTSFSEYGTNINLKELCKSNENLSYLNVNGKYDGNISDIVPFCSNLRTLKYNTLKNIDTYDALGELPQLQVLKIPYLIHSENLKQMFQKLASTNLLRELILFQDDFLGRHCFIDLEETKEICKIESLNILSSEFEDYECIKYIAQLTNLKKLTFYIVQQNSVDFSDSLLHILRECKKIEYMCFDADGLPQNFVFQAFKVLEVVRNPQKQKPLRLRLKSWEYESSLHDKEVYKPYMHLVNYKNFTSHDLFF